MKDFFLLWIFISNENIKIKISISMNNSEYFYGKDVKIEYNVYKKCNCIFFLWNYIFSLIVGKYLLFMEIIFNLLILWLWKIYLYIQILWL
jgi:hypothetical protein